MLLDQGKLDLDHPVRLYFPAISSLRGVTFRHLLNHTSGIPDYSLEKAMLDILRLVQD